MSINPDSVCGSSQGSIGTGGGILIRAHARCKTNLRASPSGHKAADGSIAAPPMAAKPRAATGLFAASIVLNQWPAEPFQTFNCAASAGWIVLLGPEKVIVPSSSAPYLIANRSSR